VNPAAVPLRELLAQAAARLARSSDSPRLDAELLLAHCLGRDRAWLMAWPERVPDMDGRDCFEALLRRREQGEPVAYLLGEREFWSLPLMVTADTLVPRPETELLVEQSLALIAGRERPRILELGTGSGAIALALKRERPDAEIIATDVSPGALAVARRNAQSLGLAVGFLLCDWYRAIAPGPRFDLIVSNPPYIAADDPFLKQGDLPAEPRRALCSGPSGLEALRIIIEGAVPRLAPGAALALEHGHDQREAVRDLLRQAGFEQLRTERDFSGLPRVSLGLKPA
jgi:release factor glutamine methyltransferase